MFVLTPRETSSIFSVLQEEAGMHTKDRSSRSFQRSIPISVSLPKKTPSMNQSTPYLMTSGADFQNQLRNMAYTAFPNAKTRSSSAVRSLIPQMTRFCSLQRDRRLSLPDLMAPNGHIMSGNI